MPRTGIEPVTRGFSVLCSTNWAIWAYKTVNKLLSCGSRIWTYDLRVMSPTSFQTAPPRVMKLTISERSDIKWMEVDSNHRSNLQQIYSLSPLATRESIHLYHHQLSWLWQDKIITHFHCKCKSFSKKILYMMKQGYWSFSILEINQKKYKKVKTWTLFDASYI